MNWPMEKIGDCCVKTQQVNPTNKPNEPFTYVDVSCVSNQSFKVTEFQQLLGSEAPSRARKQILTNDVLFATVRPYLKRVALIPEKLNGQVASTGYCVLRANTEILNPEYLYYYLLTETTLNYVIAQQKGATYPAITDGILKELKMPLPPLPEQEAIARILRAIQQAKETRQQELTFERERKAALMDYLFKQGTRKESLKQTEIGELPASWKLQPLGPLVKMNNGINFNKEQKGSGTLTVDVLNMYTDSIYLNTKKLYRVDMAMKDSDLLQPNDLLFVRSSLMQDGIGWPALFPGHAEPVSFCGFLIRAKFLSDNVLPEFLIHYLRLPKTRRLLVSKSGKVAITNINQGNIGSLLIPIPDKNEQEAIAQTLAAFDKKILALKDEINLLDELFKALLEGLMTGRLSTQPLLKESKEMVTI